MSTLSASNIRRPNLYGRPSRRGRHRRGLRVFIVVLALALSSGATWYFVILENAQAKLGQSALVCPPPTLGAHLPPPSQVTVNVYNATSRKGFAAQTAAELRKRGFTIGKVGNDPDRRQLTGIGEVKGGSLSKDQIQLVATYVESIERVQDQRMDPSIDLVIGARFTAPRTTEQAHTVLNPPRPPGCP